MNRTALVAASLLAMLGAGAAGAADDTTTPEAVPGYERTGEKTSCIRLRPIDKLEPLSETLFLVEIGDRVYANDVRGKCQGATSPFTYLQYSPTSTNLCSGDLINVVDQGGDFLRGACALGDFELLKKVEDKPAQ